MNDLISIVIPVYNVKEYLTQCFQSIVLQTYRNLEILIIDDGSSDGSKEICDIWEKKDKRIKVIHKKNGGLSDARNVGINNASGKYISFVDSDDYIALDMIEYLYNLLCNNDAQIAVCQKSNVSESGNEIENRKLKQDKLICGNNACMREFFINETINTVAWGKLYLLSIFKDIRYPIGKYHEDIFTTYKLIAKCEKIAVGKECKYYYRWRKNGISKGTFSKKHLDSIEGAILRKNFINSNYPELLIFAEANIIYASNQCIIKYIYSNENDKNIVSYIERQYKVYERSFLLGKSGLKAKIFSMAAYINLSLLIKIVRLGLTFKGKRDNDIEMF